MPINRLLFCGIGCFITFLLIVLAIISYGDSLAALYPITLCILASFIIYYYIIERSQNKRLSNWGFRPSYICFLGLFIVNLQFFIDQVIGNANVSDFLGFKWINIYLDKCFFGVCAFTISFLVANAITNRPIKTSTSSDTNIKPWIRIQFLFFVLFIINIDIASFLSGEIYYGSGASNTVETISNSFERFYGSFVIIILSIYVKNFRNQQLKLSLKSFFQKISYWFWIPLIIYLVLRLFSGDRGPVIYTVLAIAYAYFLVSNKRLNLKWSILIIISAAFLISLLGITRSRDTKISFQEKIEQSLIRMDEINTLRFPTFSPFTYELAKSSQCNFIAIRHIENEGDYTLGKFSILSAIGSFPGAKKSYFKPFGLKDEDFSSAIYLTQIFNNKKSYSYGIGSSTIAEAYLDFGVFGLILVAFLFGYIFKRIDLSFESPHNLSTGQIIVILKLSSVAIYISRASLGQAVSMVFSTLIIYWIFLIIFKFLRIKKFK